MIYYKDCDLEKGVEKLLKSFGDEPTHDYLTIEKYQQLIVDFVNGFKSDEIEDLNAEIDNRDEKLEDYSNMVHSLDGGLAALKKIVYKMRKSENKESILAIIESMEVNMS